jgi:hypothetical protein
MEGPRMRQSQLVDVGVPGSRGRREISVQAFSLAQLARDADHALMLQAIFRYGCAIHGADDVGRLGGPLRMAKGSIRSTQRHCLRRSRATGPQCDDRNLGWVGTKQAIFDARDEAFLTVR